MQRAVGLRIGLRARDRDRVRVKVRVKGEGVQRAVGLRAKSDEELEQAPRERAHLVGLEAIVAARHDGDRAWIGLGMGLGLDLG